MIFGIAAIFVLLQTVQGGVVPGPAVAPGPAVISAPSRLVAAPVAAPFVAAPSAPIVGPAPAPLFAAAPAPFAAYKAVPQAVAPFSSSLNYVARAPVLPYTVGGPVVSPFVETFSAPLVARKFSPVVASAPLITAPSPFVGGAF